MKLKRVLTLLLALILTLSMSLVGCGSGGSTQSTTAAPSAGETTAAATTASQAAAGGAQEAIINLGSEPPQMNSILTTDVTSMTVMRHTTDGLMNLDKDNNPIPGIAEKYEISTDGLKYTFHLRDAKWSDGTPVTAKDFEFAWKSVLNKANAAEYAYIMYMIKGAQEYNGGSGKVEDVGIKAVDDKTFEVTLVRPTPYFLYLTSFGVYMPVNQAFYEKQANGGKNSYGTEADKLIYNGPYIIKSWAHEDKIILEKNPNYWDAANIKLDKITMLMVKDTNAGYNMFAGGEADMVGLKGADQVAKATADGYAPAKYSDGAVAYFEFNFKDPVMKNVNIRKALTYAIDRQSLVTKVFKNSSMPALSFTNPDISGLNGKSFKSMVGDLIKDNNSDEAKQLLAKGMKELGLKTVPKLSMITDDTDVAKRDAAAYQEYWKKNLGVDVEILTMPFKSRLARMTAKDFQVVLALWGPDYNDPMTYLDMFETGNGNNHTSYSNKAYDDLLNKVRAETDQTKRFDLLVQTEKLLMEDQPIGPLYFRNRDYVVKPYLMGVVRNAFQDINMRWAYIDSSKKK